MAHFVCSVSVHDGRFVSTVCSANSVPNIEVFFHGFLTNEEEIRRHFPPHLQRLGEGTAATITAVYEKWGSNLQSRLKGEFCLAIVDHEVRRVVLTHDGLGLRSMFYVLSGRTLHFGTRVESVREAAGLTEFDDVYIVDYLRDGAPRGDRTIFRDVHRLSPCCTLTWSGDETRLSNTWNLASVPPVVYRTTSDYDEHFRTLLRAAIESRLGMKTWCELSGGMDSSSIVSMIAHEEMSPIGTVSFIYSKSHSADERSWIRPVLDYCQTDWHSIDGDVNGPFSKLPDRPLGQPTRAITMWAQFAALEEVAASDDVDVVLSGFGGDQVLGGDHPVPVHLADLLRSGRVGTLFSDLKEWQHCDSNLRPLRYHFLRSAFNPLFRYWRGRDLSIPRTKAFPPWMEPAVVARSASWPDRQYRAPRQANVDRQYLQQRIMGAAQSIPELWNQHTERIDFRYPLLDRDLLEFMFAVPWHERSKPGQDRVLQRRSLEGVLPESTRSRRDKSGPDEAIIRGLAANPRLRERLAGPSELAERGYVDKRAWASAVDSVCVGNVASLHQFLSAVSLELWLQTRESAPI